MSTTTNLKIFFKYPNKSLVKSSHQKQNLPTFPTKNPGIEKFRPKKPFDHPRHSHGERSRETITASGAKGTVTAKLLELRVFFNLFLLFASTCN